MVHRLCARSPDLRRGDTVLEDEGCSGLGRIGTGVWMAMPTSPWMQFVDADTQHLREPPLLREFGRFSPFSQETAVRVATQQRKVSASA
jgi:hypothetical protein